MQLLEALLVPASSVPPEGREYFFLDVKHQWNRKLSTAWCFLVPSFQPRALPAIHGKGRVGLAPRSGSSVRVAFSSTWAMLCSGRESRRWSQRGCSAGGVRGHCWNLGCPSALLCACLCQSNPTLLSWGKLLRRLRQPRMALLCFAEP